MQLSPFSSQAEICVNRQPQWPHLKHPLCQERSLSRISSARYTADPQLGHLGMDPRVGCRSVGRRWEGGRDQLEGRGGTLPVRFTGYLGASTGRIFAGVRTLSALTGSSVSVLGGVCGSGAGGGVTSTDSCMRIE